MINRRLPTASVPWKGGGAKYCISRLYSLKKKYIYTMADAREKNKTGCLQRISNSFICLLKRKNIQIFLAYEIILKIFEDDRNVCEEPPICWQCFRTTQESQYRNICDVIHVSHENKRIEKNESKYHKGILKMEKIREK